MSLLTERVEIDELKDGKVRHTIHMRPIAVREHGSLLAMEIDLKDSGNWARPHIATRAPLMASVANDGMRRLHPTRELDRYVEIGAPLVKVAGDWRKLDLGTVARARNALTWTGAQSITKIEHGGHFLKLAIELLDGFVPEDSQIAFPVSLSGLTRRGAQLFAEDRPVAVLQAPVMIDAGNFIDIRPIAGSFANLDGQLYWLMTLPDLTGMTRPVIDPTATLQPDATDGQDTRIFAAAAAVNFNYGTLNTINAGRTGGDNLRGMLRFDISSVPPGSIISSATLTLRCNGESDTTDRNVGVHRALTEWFEGQKNGAAPDVGQDGSTWNHRNANGSVAWAGGAGGASGSDFASTATDTKSITGPNTDFEYNVLADVAAWHAGLATNYGWWTINVSEGTNNSNKGFWSSDADTASTRPKLVIVYIEAPPAFVRAPGWGRF